MINRKLIRLKTVQVAYSYSLNNEGRRPENGENELLNSLGTAYDLYNTMLNLMVEISRLALRAHDAQANRARRLGLTEPSRKFVDNRFMLQLESNAQLQENRKTQRLDWTNEEEFVRTLFNRVMDSDFYREYMDSGVSSYEEDRELWRKIYRYVIVDNDKIDDLLEDVNIYWNDDRHIIDTFVLKTINRFTAESKDDHPLLPEFRDEEDLEFAKKLIYQSLNAADYYKNLVAQNTRNWDVERVPLMDRVIMQVALAEITSFPSIPLSVSINEYIEIAKSYSTPNSARYINATLDNISKKLIAEHKLMKNA
ncbi:MAG: transcription antitermination factor NusB [Bacteroidaceae bacterium]|nr:transcription antitermination factor NusB [Bacteroidaceae bacterium]